MDAATATFLLEFQSTPLCEGRLICPGCWDDLQRFNPRPSVRGDKRRREKRADWHGFNPRPSVRGDLAHLAREPAPAFQSTPLCEGRRPPRCR